MFVIFSCQAAPLPPLPVHQPGVFSRELSVCPAGEVVLCRSSHHCACESCHQRHALCPVRRLALFVSLQDCQDVPGQHLPGVQGETEPGIRKKKLSSFVLV